MEITVLMKTPTNFKLCMSSDLSIKLNLRKPKDWGVSLTTSASSRAIAIPKIILHDDNGQIILHCVKTSKCGGNERHVRMTNDTKIYYQPKNNVIKTRETSPKQKQVTHIKFSIIYDDRSERSAEGEKNRSLNATENNNNQMTEGNFAISETFKADVSDNDGIAWKRFIRKTSQTTKNESISGEFVHGLNGIPTGTYDETQALFKASKNAPKKCRRKNYPLLASHRPAMGSNISRRSEKALSGRRAISSGNLCHHAGKLRFFNPCMDRTTFRGSLPNHLDEKNVQAEGDGTPESFFPTNNNYRTIYGGVQLDLSKLNTLDQGYASERSPDEESVASVFDDETLLGLPFITKETVFEVKLEKGIRGLGLSVAGGVESSEPLPGLIRIKRLFPNQPAWESGQLQIADILLQVNGESLTGLTNYEALEVLRTAHQSVCLRVCRPPAEVLKTLLKPLDDGIGPPAPPLRRNPSEPVSSLPSNNTHLSLLVLNEPCGEFDVTLKKVNGSLGFTLRKGDESVLGHYVRALVREPAISDGRIRPGDKILAVNGQDISPLSHEEAVQLLRKAGDTVTLKLYRDAGQTPVAALSPTEESLADLNLHHAHPLDIPKPAQKPLRQEAVDMLTDLALRRQNQPGSPRRRQLPQKSSTSRPTNLPLNPDEPASLPPTVEGDTEIDGEGSRGLLKWKGVLFVGGDGEKQKLTVELCRGWNSRLGFSLQTDSDGYSVITAIYADSVAAKDGRLQPGDRIMMINEESIEGMKTCQVIDLLRKIRGSVLITIERGIT